MREDSIRTVGLDLGDKWTHFCVLDARGEVAARGRTPTTETGIRKRWGRGERFRIGLETGTHSPWVSRLLEELDHEVIVANARETRLGRRSKKSDRVDAEQLARWTRSDPELLAPVRHRGAQAQADRAFLSARDVAVASRAQLINCVRSLVKSQGSRLPSCSAAAFARKVAGGIPSCLGPALTPLLEQISSLTRVIRHYDGQIEAVSEERYPVTAHLRRIRGVGPITALAYVLAIEDPHRFTRSRKVGAYVGLVPRKEQSGDRDPQLHITKAGDRLLRRLLLQCAHYILGPFGEDCDLRRWAQAKIEHGGRASRKRALVAVARKLAVKMHRLWVTGEIYDPLRLAHARGEAAV